MPALNIATPNRWLCPVRVAVVVALSLWFAACTSKEAPQPAFDKRDFTGMWFLAGQSLDASLASGVGNVTGAPGRGTSLRPARYGNYAELKGAYLQAFQDFQKLKETSGNPWTAKCTPNGMPMLMAGVYGNEVLQAPLQINWFQEYFQETRRIYLDGRPHPDPNKYPATFSGHSTGSWEGDTLVVETVNIRGDTPLDEQGRGHSEKIRIVERITRPEENRLQIQAVVEDPDAFVQPWRYTLNYNRHVGQEPVEFVCTDNNAESVDPETGLEATVIPARKNLPQPARE